MAKPGVVTSYAKEPRSYWVKTDSSTIRRNRYHLMELSTRKQQVTANISAGNTKNSGGPVIQPERTDQGSSTRPRLSIPFRIQPIGHPNQNNLQDAGKTASKATQTEHSPTSKLDTSINSDITGTEMLDTGLQGTELDDTVTSDFAGFRMSEIGPLYQTTSKSNGAVSTQGTSGSPGGMTTRSGLVVRPPKEHP
ncbi:hypothetical protein GE061_013396 [Apolygus lucorum]|uniref:Uncharacterized protein n=1 Tax=Apolygus lucorum TaxID=248454 RepID=A0A8S9XMK6_APOLU|nr:hypothetical protein GE061_013396 [Apolygus lucorum]